jgi:uncharacterized protein (DUF1800 family)
MPKPPDVTSYEDAAHLLRRVGFGGTRAEIEALVPLSWEAAVDRVLDTSKAPAPRPGPSLPAPGTALSGEQWHNAYLAMTSWWLDRARTTPVPVIEKLTLFWHGHMPSSLDVVPHKLLFDQNQLYRSKSLGRVDELVQAASVHPAMLIYLDNRANAAGWPNENFARELMELFTLGVGKYSEDDVREAARAWTGHTMDTATWSYRFRSEWHDHGNKTFMGVTQPWDGPQIIQHILRGPKQRTAAGFLARKMWRFLAGTKPTSAVIDDVAAKFIAGDMRTKALVRAILLRPEFRSPEVRNGLVRSPFDFIVAALRHTGMSAADIRPQWLMPGMGQELFRPPNVDGWGTNAYWISTSAAWAKSTLADQIAWKANERNLLSGSEKRSVADAVSVALQHFDITQPSATTRAAMEQFVRSERSSRKWAERWGLVSLALMSPEFQLA